ncbi:amino acid ABC transporter substrate-binding protein, PAAT family [Variovorax sp. YR634]|jgi:ABC-type amino acid transport substrate-binding protein|uniref:ABC transporter substrate-binding protein n=1 Tax=Variovorax sp. YR634 TaxID=1884385 RepID=UPI00089452AD|nr:ABC transporter substrate-binding protein [Variovorax sp. YR634]SDZ45215.1 amino acid ABC transporter substrate-binding protein, PAAT family [Variovorax sp. YR634]
MKILSALAAAAISVCTIFGPASAQAQQKVSKLTSIPQKGKVRVCQVPNYYAISFRNPKTGDLEGIDVDLSKELAKELGVQLEIIETNFSTFVADLQADKCDIGMFAVAATLKRAKAVEFSNPYLESGLYAIVKDGSKIQKWADVDQPGVRVVTGLGSFMDDIMKTYLKKATQRSVVPPADMLSELAANKADVYISDYPASVRIRKEFDWAKLIAPSEPLAVTPYSYVVAPGDQIWLNYINLFVRTIRNDGRLKKYAEKHNLGPMVTK